MGRKYDVSIIIPVYNEESTIERLINQVLKVNFGKYSVEIFVVDDGSTDRTQDILASHPARKKFITIRLPKNRGKGAAVRAGITRSTGKALVIQDADFEYEPRDIKKLVEPILSKKARVVYGSRFLGKIKRMTSLRKVANKLLTFYVNLVYGTRTSDACTCYKTFDGDLVRSFKLRSNGFEFCHELTANVGRRRVPIIEVPITYSARLITESIKSSWVDFFKQLHLIIQFRRRLWQK